MTHAGDLVAELLIRYGVTHVFGQPGGQTALYDGLARRAPRIRPSTPIHSYRRRLAEGKTYPRPGAVYELPPWRRSPAEPASGRVGGEPCSL